jgi:membrane associated rhomboid family serine protease
MSGNSQKVAVDLRLHPIRVHGLIAMGIEDRQYYRDDEGSSWRAGSSMFSQSAVLTIIVINIVIFLLDLFSPGMPEGRLRTLNSFMALTSDLSSQPWNFWKLLTYGFAHASADIWHIGANMLVLWFLGRPLEDRLGRSEFWKFYLISIVVAGLIFVVVHMFTGSLGRAVGASGAVSAVVALFIFMYPKQTLLFFGVLPMPAWLLGVIVVVMDMLNSLNPNSPIAAECHLAGFAFGALYFLLQWNFRWLRFEALSNLMKVRPRLKIHHPEADLKLRKQADEILQKINDHGEESLTARERNILKQYSEHVRRQRG